MKCAYLITDFCLRVPKAKENEKWFCQREAELWLLGFFSIPTGQQIYTLMANTAGCSPALPSASRAACACFREFLIFRLSVDTPEALLLAVSCSGTECSSVGKLLPCASSTFPSSLQPCLLLCLLRTTGRCRVFLSSAKAGS